MNRRLPVRALLVVFLAGTVAAGLVPAAETKTGKTADAEEQRQQQVIERFLGVLEKNPRRGTALDRVYGHHVERGTLDQLVEDYRQRTAQNAADGPAWMMLGLIDAQRGQDAAAVAAFEQAEMLDVFQALGLAVRAGDVERAREAAERLFGLRLDAETQVQLAAQMRQWACTTWPRPSCRAPIARPATAWPRWWH